MLQSIQNIHYTGHQNRHKYINISTHSCTHSNIRAHITTAYATWQTSSSYTTCLMDKMHYKLFTESISFTHRRSIAEPGGCSQRHLFVCLSVCLFVNTITSERLNTGWWNLAVRCIVQKSRPSSNVKVKGQRLRSLGTKNEKAPFCSGVVLWGRSSCGILSASGPRGRVNKTK